MEKDSKILLLSKHSLNACSLPAIIITLKGEITKCNSGAELLFKQSVNKLTEKSIFDVLSPAVNQKWLNSIVKEIETNDFAECETEISHENNLFNRLKISFYPDYKNPKDLSHIILVLREIAPSPSLAKDLILEEEKFRFLFENMKEGCAIHKLIEDKHGKPINYKITEVNTSYENTLGIKANEACGKLASKLYQTNEAPFLKEYAEVVETGNPIEFSAYFPPMDKHFNISVSRVRPMFFATIFSDITDQVKAKERLTESEEKFRSLYDNAPLPYQSLHSDGSFKDVNPAWLSTLGYERDEVIGKKYVDFLHPDWQAHFNKNFPAFKKRGYVNDVQFRIRHKKGHYLHISFEGCIGYHPDGSFKQTYCVFKDITLQVKAERELLESEHKFRLLAENTKDWEYWIDENDNFQFISSGCKQITGYTAGEFLANPELKDQIIHPDDRDMVINDHKTIGLSEAPNHHSKFRIVHKNGQEVWVEHICIPVYNDEGNFIGRRGNNRDITTQVKYEKDLIKAKKKAEESDKIKSAFLANMSHEIRTPMNGILGFIDLLKSPDLSANEREEYSTTVEKSSIRLLDTINDIIELSEIEAGDAIVNDDTICISEMMQNMLDLYEPKAHEKGIKIELEICDNLPETIHSDKAKLKSVLANLIKNAIKFTNKGTIQIGCKHEKNKLKLWVKDTGRGIEEEKLNQIFERFTQGHIEISRGYEGSGLGLAICKAYTEMLGGKIGVNSEVDKGSTFFFTIDYNHSSASKLPTSKLQPEPKEKMEKMKTDKSDKKSILIAEDDIVSFYFLQVVAEELGFNVIHAINGKEAVELCIANPDITIVLMDLKMPVMDGYEATKQIKAIKNDCYIIAQTAFALGNDEHKALEAGCDDFISKPINKEILVKKLLKKA